MTETHRVHLLPKSHPDPTTWAHIVSAQKTFRLHALKTSPESFSSSYAREAAFTDSEWEARLQNPLALTLVAVKSPPTEASTTEEDNDSAQTCIKGEWEGTAVLVGPLPPKSDRDTTVFEIFGLFVLPSARGHGIGARLIETAISEAVARAGEGGGARRVVVRVRAAAGNAKVVGLYERSGFGIVEGREAEDGEILMELRRRV